MSTIPINNLQPSTTPPPDSSIHGIVTLSWPYSSSTRECALLLADPDFRLRSRQGQVRVRFTGASAEAVAKSHVGIGDEVVLHLDGARWEDDPEKTRTPGKSVDGELFFRRKLGLRVKRRDGDVRVEVDAPPSPPRESQKDGNGVVATPVPKAVGRLRAGLDGTSKYAYTSPAFVKRLRLSGDEFLESAYDPFAGDDMDVDDGEDGSRYSFGRTINWKYAQKTPSPTKETYARDEIWEHTSPTRDKRVTRSTAQQQDETTEQMPPPPLPNLKVPQSSMQPPSEPHVSTRVQDRPSTPELHLVQSPNLPLPSPFPTEAFAQNQFGLPSAGTVVEEETQQASKDVTTSRDGAVMVDLSDTAQSSDNLRKDQATEPPLGRTQLEKTPTTPLTSGFGFGFDGTVASGIAPQKKSPQEVEKEKVMAKTFSSLFGFTGQPQTPAQGQEQGRVPKLESPTQSKAARPPMEQEKLEASFGRPAKISQDIIDESGEEVHAPEIEEPPIQQTQAPTVTHEVPPEPQTQKEEVEVIEIDSDSDVESEVSEVDQLPEHQAAQTQRSTRSVTSRSKSVEIPDTYQDSQAEDLMISQQRRQEATSTLQSQENFATLQRQRTDDSILESFIEQDKLYPTLPVADGQPDVSREDGVKVTSPDAEANKMTEFESQQQQAPQQQQTLQQPSYPSLPITPSNSQTIEGMASQTALEVPETMRDTFPPTPQLTQAGSSATRLQDSLGTQEWASQEQPRAKPEKAQDEVVEEPAVSQQQKPEFLTQEQMEEEASKPSQPSELEPPAQQVKQPEAGRMTRAKSKKARASRVSNIPDAISSYFSPKRSSIAAAAIEKEADKSVEISKPEHTTNGHVFAQSKGKAKVPELQSSFSTSSAYFTPLSSISTLLNPSSQQTYGSNAIDVFAVITDSTTDPVRAKKGPRDYYTIFRVTDSSLDQNESVRVEVFRPFKSSLPVAKIGDVILLRAFTVKSQKGSPYLLSTDASAWCVFRHVQPANGASGKGKDKPAWALKADEKNGDGLSEEMKGPPVEFGEEEREHARDLRSWWEVVYSEQEVNGMNDVNDDEVMAGSGINGHVNQAAVATKL